MGLPDWPAMCESPLFHNRDDCHTTSLSGSANSHLSLNGRLQSFLEIQVIFSVSFTVLSVSLRPNRVVQGMAY